MIIVIDDQTRAGGVDVLPLHAGGGEGVDDESGREHVREADTDRRGRWPHHVGAVTDRQSESEVEDLEGITH